LRARSARRSATCALARHLPDSGIDATRVSHRSQAVVLRAIRGVDFSQRLRRGGDCYCWSVRLRTSFFTFSKRLV
jgi:hypothetical protein